MDEKLSPPVASPARGEERGYFLGIPIKVDASVPRDEVWFVQNQTIVGKIVGVDVRPVRGILQE